jgi:hypothetical protein
MPKSSRRIENGGPCTCLPKQRMGPSKKERSENDLDNFMMGFSNAEHNWVDTRELSHR